MHQDALTGAHARGRVKQVVGGQSLHRKGGGLFPSDRVGQWHQLGNGGDRGLRVARAGHCRHPAAEQGRVDAVTRRFDHAGRFCSGDPGQAHLSIQAMPPFRVGEVHARHRHANAQLAGPRLWLSHLLEGEDLRPPEPPHHDRFHVGCARAPVGGASRSPLSSSTLGVRPEKLGQEHPVLVLGSPHETALDDRHPPDDDVAGGFSVQAPAECDEVASNPPRPSRRRPTTFMPGSGASSIV